VYPTSACTSWGCMCGHGTVLTQRHRILCRALPLWRALPSLLGVCVRALLMESYKQTACVGVALVDSHAFAK